MNKERYNQIIDSTYKSYLRKAKNQTTEDLFGSMIKGDEIIHGMLESHTRDFIPYTREQFIDKCKTNKEFSERWGLKIEERELDMFERYEHLRTHKYSGKWDGIGDAMEYYNSINVPTKLITVTYNNETIEVYE